MAFPPPDKPPPWTVLVTGASVGVGLAVARELIANTPHRVVLTARPSSMKRFAEAGIEPSDRVLLRALDVTSHDQRAALIHELVESYGAVDALVNNAGVMMRSVVEHVTEDERLAQMDVNFLAPMALTRLCLPQMRAQRFGRVVSVSSVGGMSAMPTMAVYSASKYALEGASEALWYEVRPWNISVSLVQPGFIKSDGFKKVWYSEQSRAALEQTGVPYHEHYANMELLTEQLMMLTFHTPQSVGRTIARTVQRRRPPLRVAGTWDAFGFAIARRLLPQRIYHAVLYAGLPQVWRWGGDATRR